jgi:hypothetical protein
MFPEAATAEIMHVIDTQHYSLTRGISPFERFRGLQSETLTFASAADLAAFLSQDWDESSLVQSGIEKKFSNDPSYRKMCRLRTRLKDLPTFQSYRRGTNSRKCNNALLRAAEGALLNAKEQQMIENLRTEIAASPITMGAGQTIFYGLGRDLPMGKTTQLEIPYFLSTTLSLVVAATHAFRKSAALHDPTIRQQLPVVMGIALNAPHKAIFAPWGKPHEYELLFDCGAKLVIDNVFRWPGGEFEYVEAHLCR